MTGKAKNPLTAEEAEKAVRKASSLFWTQIVPLIVIAQEEFLKVYDEYEERNGRNPQIVSWMNIAKSNFDDFYEWLGAGDKRYRNLVLDYAIGVSKRMQKPILDLYLTFKLYFDKKKLKDTRFAAQLELAITLIHLSKDLWDKFFDLFVEKNGFDIRNNYLSARMSDADIFFEKVVQVLLQPKKYKLQPTKNYASIKAFEAFSDKLLAPENIDAAGLDALKWNHFDVEAAEIEREALGVNKLKEKYNVKIQK